MGQQILNDRMVALGTKLVNKFAPTTGTVTVTRQQPSVDYDPLTGSETPNTPIDTVLDASPPVPVTQKMVRGIEAVLEGDMVTYIAGESYDFERMDINSLRLTYTGAGTFTMIWYKELWAGVDIAAYEVFLRNV
jgi:hypothetical protein